MVDYWLLTLKPALSSKAFGESGEVNLKTALGDVRPGEYANTSPPVVVGDVVVIGANVADNTRVDVPSGVIRGL